VLWALHIFNTPINFMWTIFKHLTLPLIELTLIEQLGSCALLLYD